MDGNARQRHRSAAFWYRAYPEVIRRRRERATALELVEHLASIDETLVCIAAGIRSLASRLEALEHAVLALEERSA